MKKVLLLAVMALFLNSCVTIGKYMVNYVTIDYSKYTEKGFFITESNSVNFDYKPIGSISIESVSGNVAVESNDSYSEHYKPASLKDAFDKLHTIGLEKGANGVINVKMDYLNSFKDPSSGVIYMGRWVVTGMLISKK